MKKYFGLLIVSWAIGFPAGSQVIVSPGNSTPHPSAGLEVSFTDKGFLPPRMTQAQRNAIVDPAEGLIVVCTDCGTEGTAVLSIFLNGVWIPISGSCPLPSSPGPGAHSPTAVQIVWNWNSAAGAAGYRWNTSNNFSTGEDLGAATSKTEAGLVCDSAYTRYVWAYNACGSSSPATLSGSTLPCHICGQPLTVNHTAGTVAPVTKTVTYETVANVPGAATKCWITRNLGAGQQAIAVNDGTEASAGWYWQFNRKQGFKHDGTTVTPAWTVSSINQSSDWQAENDPCTLELGSSWRIPTSTEWQNLISAGAWTNWSGPWSSLLKLHAAGYLANSNGLLNLRGSSGYYWSGTQVNNLDGNYFYFYDIYAGMGLNSKAFGLSLRCLSE